MIAAATALAAGCGDGGGGSSAGAPPTTSQTTQAQIADASAGAMEQTTEVATDALVESGKPGATSSKTGVPAGASSAAGTTINYQASVTVQVDLDMLNASGQDAFPNASGIFSVSATGTVVGDPTAGQVHYQAVVTWVTDGLFTDPVCGAQARVAAGSSWTFTAAIQWAYTDDLNWSIQATSDFTGAAAGTVTYQGKTWDVNGTVQVHAFASFSRTAGVWSFSAGISGQRTVVVTDGTVTHTVVITMQAIDHILIEVDGVTFGPYTLAQVWWFWHFDCDD
jgi:hypothetical protein